MNQHRFSESETLIKRTMANAWSKKDTSLLSYCYGSYASLLLSKPDKEPYKAIELITTLTDSLNYPFSKDLLSKLAYAYSLTGKKKEAYSVLSAANRISGEIAEQCILENAEYLVAKHSGDLGQALNHLENANSIQDSLLREMFRQSAVKAQRDYFREQSIENRKAAKNREMTGLGVAISLLLAFSVAAFLFVSKRKKTMNEYVALIDELKNQNENTRLYDDNAKAFVMNLFKDQFRLLNGILYRYYTRGEDRNAIYSEVKSLVEQFQKNERIDKELEEILNHSCDEIMARFRIEFPRLKKDSYRLMSYWVAGLSNNVMVMFLNESIDNLYNRKSRLRHTIELSQSEHKEQFLSAISHK